MIAGGQANPVEMISGDPTYPIMQLIGFLKIRKGIYFMDANAGKTSLVNRIGVANLLALAATPVATGVIQAGL